MSTPAIGPYTPVVVSGDLVFVSGQVGLADGAIVEGGLAAQTQQAMRNLAGQLDSVGASLTDVVKTTCFLTDMSHYGEFNQHYVAALGDHRPARSCVAVAALPAGALVEVEAIARVS